MHHFDAEAGRAPFQKKKGYYPFEGQSSVSTRQHLGSWVGTNSHYSHLACLGHLDHNLPFEQCLKQTVSRRICLRSE